MTRTTSISAQNSAFQKRKQRCDQQLKNNKITFAEYQQRARWQWYSSPDKVPPIEKGQKNLKGWVGKAKRKEKDSGKSGGKQKMVEEVDVVRLLVGMRLRMRLGLEMRWRGEVVMLWMRRHYHAGRLLIWFQRRLTSHD